MKCSEEHVIRCAHIVVATNNQKSVIFINPR